MKKHIIIFGLLSVLLVTSLLVGCGGGTSQTTTTPGGTTTTPGGTTTSESTTQTNTSTPATTSENLADIVGQAANFPNVYYEMTTTSNGIKMTVKYWMKPNKIKAEMPESGVITYIDMAEHTMYMYTESTNMAIKMTYDPGQVPENPDAVLGYTPNIVGTETIDGKDCTIIEYSYQGGSVKSWIWNDNGYPVRMETTTNGITAVIEWKNFDFSPIPDSEFELPAGVEIVDMS